MFTNYARSSLSFNIDFLNWINTEIAEITVTARTGEFNGTD